MTPWEVVGVRHQQHPDRHRLQWDPPPTAVGYSGRHSHLVFPSESAVKAAAQCHTARTGAHGSVTQRGEGRGPWWQMDIDGKSSSSDIMYDYVLLSHIDVPQLSSSSELHQLATHCRTPAGMPDLTHNLQSSYGYRTPSWLYGHKQTRETVHTYISSIGCFSRPSQHHSPKHHTAPLKHNPVTTTTSSTSSTSTTPTTTATIRFTTTTTTSMCSSVRPHSQSRGPQICPLPFWHAPRHA